MRIPSIRIRELLILAGLVVVSIFAFDRCQGERNAAWEARAVAAEVLSEVLSARVDSLVVEAESLRSQAVATVDAIVISRAPVTDSMVASLPPAVTVGEQDRDVVIERLTGERDDALSAFETQSRAMALLQSALDTQTQRADTLEAVLRDRPGPRPWYIPELVVGPSAGWCSFPANGPCVAPVSVTLGWKIKL